MWRNTEIKRKRERKKEISPLKFLHRNAIRYLRVFRRYWLFLEMFKSDGLSWWKIDKSNFNSQTKIFGKFSLATYKICDGMWNLKNSLDKN